MEAHKETIVHYHVKQCAQFTLGTSHLETMPRMSHSRSGRNGSNDLLRRNTRALSHSGQTIAAAEAANKGGNVTILPPCSHFALIHPFSTALDSNTALPRECRTTGSCLTSSLLNRNRLLSLQCATANGPCRYHLPHSIATSALPLARFTLPHARFFQQHRPQSSRRSARDAVSH